MCKQHITTLPTLLQSDDVLVTNNQWLSLTDQLNLGVRLVELDTHWFQGALRMGHCGGLHAPVLNAFLHILNVLSKLAGAPCYYKIRTFLARNVWLYSIKRSLPDA